jgi:hypothetical protein
MLHQLIESQNFDEKLRSAKYYSLNLQQCCARLIAPSDRLESQLGSSVRSLFLVAEIDGMTMHQK